MIVLHNGIITNYKHLNKKYSFDRNTELDTYVINELFELFLKNNSLIEATNLVMQELEGEASLFIFFKKEEKFFIYTNTGSIFYTDNNNELVLFSSEEWITKKFQTKECNQLKPFTGIFLIINQG